MPKTWAYRICQAVAVPVLLGNSPAAFAQSTESTTIEEIVVTATRREANLQDVPIAVTALTQSSMLESGLQSIQQLTDLNPSLSFDTAQSFQRNSLKIRGIGTIGNSRTFEGAVGVFVDGIYRSRSGMALADLVDIEQIEILRGPQSTLFGKNTVAGAIALQSRSPDFSGPEGSAELRLGNLDSIYFAGAANFPLGDSTAFRIAATLNRRDGFFRSPDTGDYYDDVDRYGIKAQALFDPPNDWQIRLIADVAESDANCCWGSAIVVNGPTAPLIETYSSLNGLSFFPAPAAERRRAASLNTLPRERIKDRGLAGIVAWDNGTFAVKSTTAFRAWSHNQIMADPDFVAAGLFVLNEPADIDSFFQELSVSFNVANTDALLGAYYSTEDYFSLRSAENGSDADDYLNALVSAGLGAVACLPPIVAADCAFPTGISALLPNGEFAREAYFQDSETLAVFGHTVTRLSERFKLVAGLRLSIEDKEGGVDNLFWYDSPIVRAALEAGGLPDDGTPRNGLDLIGTVFGPSFTDDIRDEELTGVLALQYSTSPNLMFYGSYQRGYKAGGVNLFREAVVTNGTVYQPEFADNFEIGLKADYWGDKARTNVSVFHSEFSDLQINFFSGLEFRTENTGKATSKGIEVENQFQLTDELRVDLAINYLDAQFDRIDNPLLAFLINRDTPRAPEWSSAVALNYVKPLTSQFNLVVNASASYMGSHFVGADTPLETRQGDYVISNASIGLRTQDDRWEVLAWCSNCGDETYRTIFFNSTFQPGSFSAYLNPPRQYGLGFRINY